MATIIIPQTPREAATRLGSLDRLIHATEWEKAAIVAAFVRLEGDAIPRSKVTSESAAQFAERGINGLRSKNTVVRYVKRWLEYSNGAYPKPGARVKLPDLEWLPMRTGTDGYETDEGAAKTIERIKSTPQGQRAIANAISRDKELADVVANDDGAWAATFDARVHEDARYASGIRDSGTGRGDTSTPLSPVLSAMMKMKMQMGTLVYRDGGKAMYEAILARSREPQPWRPGELEALIADIEEGQRYGADSKALLTPVSDEDLVDLLSTRKEDT